MLAADNENQFQDSLENNITIHFESNNVKAALDNAIANWWTNSNFVRLLLHHGASVDLQDYKGRTALMFAAAFCNTDAVKAILEHQADVDIPDELGQTSLFYAFLHYNLDIYKYPDEIQEEKEKLWYTIF